MYNLLPPEQKKVIRREYVFRLVILVLNFFILTGVVAVTLLAPSLLLLNLKDSSLSTEIKKLEFETPELKNMEDLQLMVSKTGENLKILNTKKTILPSVVWKEAVLGLRGITIKSFSFLRNTENISVSFGGEAETREILTVFVKNLEEKEIFTDVHLPVSSLAKDKEIDFSISFLVESREDKKQK